MSSKLLITCNRALVPRPTYRRNVTIRASQEATPSTTTPQPSQYTLTIRKPLGMVLAESPKGVVVEEINPGGNAAASGQIQVGDILVKTSAVVLKSGQEGKYEKEGYGNRVYDNWETIEFDCAGQTFDTVLAAIGSNNERWGIMKVTLTLARPTE